MPTTRDASTRTSAEGQAGGTPGRQDGVPPRGEQWGLVPPEVSRSPLVPPPSSLLLAEPGLRAQEVVVADLAASPLDDRIHTPEPVDEG